MSTNRIIHFASNANASNDHHDGANRCVVPLDIESAKELLRIDRETADYLARLNGKVQRSSPTVELGQTPVDFVFLSAEGELGDDLDEAVGDSGEFAVLPERPGVNWLQTGKVERVECRALEIWAGQGIYFRALCRHSETWLSSEMLPLSIIQRVAEGLSVEDAEDAAARG